MNELYTHKKYGGYKITEYIDSKNVTIQFLLTGTMYTTQMKDVRSGCVRDYFSPQIYGVGYFGVGVHKAYVDGKVTGVYGVWHSMISRCYSEKVQKRMPWYIGCSVCKEWHCFQVFANWYVSNHSEGLHMDKDKKIFGNKIYSPDTILFLSQKENTLISTQKKHRFTSPNGSVVEFVNLNRFCRENNLDRVCMSKVKSGRRKSHKGWTSI